jgi:hypothetical protein
MEEENPSFSQNYEKAPQSLKDKLYFRIRGLLGKLAVKKVKNIENMYEQKSDTQSLQMEAGYDLKRIQEMDKRRRNESSQKAVLNDYSIARETIARLNNFLRGSTPAKNMGYYSPKDFDFQDRRRYIDDKTIIFNPDKIISSEDVSSFLDGVEGIFKKQEIPFNKKRYQEFLLKRLKKYHELNLDFEKNNLLEYLEKNNKRVNEVDLSERIGYLNTIKSISSKTLPQEELTQKLRGVPLDYSSALEHYKHNSKTFSLSKFSKEFNKEIISAIPYMQKKRAFNNNPALQEKFGAFAPSLSYLDFLENHLQRRDAMLSASAVDSSSKSRENFFSPIGIVLGEGEIYDASPHDLESYSNSKIRISSFMKGKNSAGNTSLEERIRESALNQPQINEFIIGNYTPKAIYFIRDVLEEWYDKSPRDSAVVHEKDLMDDPRKVINNLSNLAEKNNLPLYEFKEGEGFSLYNPKKEKNYFKKSTFKGRRKHRI